MTSPLKILLLEDNHNDAELILSLLGTELKNWEYRLVSDEHEFVKALLDFVPDIILSDNILPQFSGGQALNIVRQHSILTPFIVVTGAVSEEYAVMMIKQGADDYILKDRMARLPAAIEAALRQRRVQKENIAATERLKKSEESFRAITERISDGFVAIDKNWHYTYVNKAAGKILNRDPSVLTGRHTWTEFPEPMVRPFYDAFHTAMEMQQYVHLEAYFLPLDNWIESNIYPSVEGLSVFFRDITIRKKEAQQLELAYKRLAFHIENAPLGFIEWDRDLHVKSWSKQAEAIFGWTEQEFISQQKNGYTQVWEEDLPAAMEIASQLISGSVERNSAQHRNYTKSGTVIWCEWFNSVLKNSDGEVETVLSLVQDITERKQAEEDLRQSEIRLNEAQAIAHISNWEIDMIKGVYSWSNEFYRIYGLKIGEVQPSEEFFISRMHPESVALAQQKMQEAFLSATDSFFEFRFIRKDGAIRYGYTEWKFKFDNKGKPVRLFGILQDITARKEAEQLVQQTSERFEYATRASSDIIWELNFATRELKVHEGKEKFFGKKTVINWALAAEGKYIPEEDREKVRNSFAAAKKDISRKLWEMEYKIYASGKSTLYIVNHAIFIRDEKGRALRVFGAITDITDKKKLQTELLEQQKKEQLKIIATALEAQEKERHAIGIELHDNVNQILAGTKLLLSVAAMRPEKAMEMIAVASQNLEDAIRENRKIAHVFVAPDIDETGLVDKVKKLAASMLDNAGIKTSLSFATFKEDLLDKDRKINIYRIIQEQCTNITKYAEAKHVRITFASTKKAFKMTIADDGKGMKTDKITSGIGLKNIVGRLSIFNGTAKVTTAPGKGFVLDIIIPHA